MKMLLGDCFYVFGGVSVTGSIKLRVDRAVENGLGRWRSRVALTADSEHGPTVN